MSKTTTDAYVQGEQAGAKFCDKDNVDVAKCPYPDGSPEAEQWWKGFGNASGLVEFRDEM